MEYPIATGFEGYPFELRRSFGWYLPCVEFRTGPCFALYMKQPGCLDFIRVRSIPRHPNPLGP